MKMPDLVAGVPNPYVMHRHPYPTRYHGSIYTRPVFGLPYVVRPQGVFRPANFYANWPAAPSTPATAGLGDTVINTGCGVFRNPRSDGGGIFNRSLSGCTACGEVGDAAKLAAFFGAAAVCGLATYFVMKRKKGSRS